MTLTQLSAFVLVARLGSVKAAANALASASRPSPRRSPRCGSTSATSCSSRDGAGMGLTAGGSRLLTIAAQMVGARRGGRGGGALRARRAGPAAAGRAEHDRGVRGRPAGRRVRQPAARAPSRCRPGWRRPPRWRVLVPQRLADVALGPRRSTAASGWSASRSSAAGWWCWPPRRALRGRAERTGRGWSDPSATDPDSDVGRLLRQLGRAGGAGERLPQPDRGLGGRRPRGRGGTRAAPTWPCTSCAAASCTSWRSPKTPVEVCWHATTLPTDRRPAAAGSLRHFLATPEAMRLLRAPGAGVPPSRFRPPVYVTIWS